MIEKLDYYAKCFQKISTYRRFVDETKYISFLIKNEELLEKYG